MLSGLETEGHQLSHTHTAAPPSPPRQMGEKGLNLNGRHDNEWSISNHGNRSMNIAWVELRALLHEKGLLPFPSTRFRISTDSQS